MSGLVFVDTETTGLDPDQHQIWEVALIVDGNEHSWFLEVDLGRADSRALAVGQFHERHPRGHLREHVAKPTTPTHKVAQQVARLTAGRHLVGAVVSFDEERLRKLLRANGACPEWHYHLVDVEALVAGHLGIEPPWKSDELSAKAGVDPEQFDRHTALGDARWAKSLYESVFAAPVEDQS